MARVYGTAPRAPVHCRQYSLHLWVWWRTHERKSDHAAYSKDLQGNALRETYPDLWHIHYFIKTVPKATRSDWSTGAYMVTRLQGTDDSVGLPNVFFFFFFCCLLFSSRRISDLHKNGSCRLGFGLSQQWVLGAVFCMLATNVDLCSFTRVKRRCWSLTCVWNWAEWLVVLKSRWAPLKFQPATTPFASFWKEAVLFIWPNGCQGER